MKLTEVAPVVFRSWVHQTLSTPSRVVFIAGENGVGKSSLRDLIAWCLTGKVVNPIDGSIAAPAEESVPQMVPEARVGASVVVDGLGRVTRTWKSGQNGLLVTGPTDWTGTSTVQQQALYQALGTSEAPILTLLHSKLFVRLHHATVKKLLLDLLNVTVEIDGKPLSLDALESAYKEAFEARRQAKQRLQGLIVPPEPTWSLDVPQHPVSAFEGRLGQLRTQFADLKQQAGETIGRRRTIVDKLNRLVLIEPVQTLGLAERVADLEERLRQLEEEMTPAERQPELAGAVARLTATGVAGELQILKSKAEALADHHPSNGCVLDPTVPCETARVRFTKRAKAIREELATAQPPATLPPPPSTSTAVSPLSELRQAAGSLLTQLRRELAEATTALNQSAQAWETYRANVDEADALRAELQSLPETSAHEQDLIEVELKIQKGETIIASARAFETAVAGHLKAKEARKAVEADVARLEARCTLLGPTGARVAALETAVAGFEALVNPVLEPFGWTLRLSVEPWQVIVNGRLLETYSESERYRIGIAFQIAIAQVSGLKFALVDELDLLDTANRKIVGALLYQAPLDQVIILRTQDPEVALPVAPGVLAYRLGKQDGRSQVLERSPQ